MEGINSKDKIGEFIEDNQLTLFAAVFLGPIGEDDSSQLGGIVATRVDAVDDKMSERLNLRLKTALREWLLEEGLADKMFTRYDGEGDVNAN